MPQAKSAAKKITQNNAKKPQKISSLSIEKTKTELLKKAVHGHGNKIISKRGFLETLFSLTFRGFVYPQIWEDPEVDLPALKIDKDQSRIMTIASGGCNVMNYLTEDPASVRAIDLNPAHVALTRLKLCAAKHLPDYESFFSFFGHADKKQNIDNYNKYIAPNLDPFSKKYWEGYSLIHGRRINYFRKNIYQFGILGRFIGAVHLLAKIYGEDPRDILKAKTLKEQGEVYDRTLGPIFKKKIVKMICNMPPALYGLGIPPSQFDELNEAAKSKGNDMAGLLNDRLRRLACDFPVETNYFAWQAFGRGYDKLNRKAIPRYLTKDNYEKLKANADRVEVHNTLITEFLQSQPQESLDCFVFLDAQDWMTEQQLRELWSEVLRTAAPGARVIFRTAGVDSPLTNALTPDVLKRFHYDPAASAAAVKRDRSSIYGGFHVYTLGGEVGLQRAKAKKAEVAATKAASKPKAKPAKAKKAVAVKAKTPAKAKAKPATAKTAAVKSAPVKPAAAKKPVAKKKTAVKKAMVKKAAAPKAATAKKPAAVKKAPVKKPATAAKPAAPVKA
jgi:S-adenosylmethionine-diacylglycerol 3-amino-3-carboxypropyl transferase